MAWNEPGGGKDPWGNRNTAEKGPPDLDEVVRKIQRKLGGLFGSSKRGGGMNAFGLSAILAVVAFIWALSGFYIINEGTRGVVLQFGAYKDTTGPGLHWYPRFVQSVEIVNVDSVQSVELGNRSEEALMLTQDENIVDAKFAVQYRVKDARDYLFNVRDADMTLRQITESAIREVVGKSKMDFIITGGRSEIVAESQRLLQETLDRYQAGLEVVSLTMQNAQAPEQVQGAFADAVKAREDEQRFINEAEAYSNDVLPRARGAAARVMEEANAYKSKVIAEAEGETSRFLAVLEQYSKAPAVTRDRLYISALESVLNKSSKVFVDTRNGNNLLYLPLDKLTRRDEGQVTGAANPQTGVTNEQPQNAATPALGDARSRDNQRRREVR